MGDYDGNGAEASPALEAFFSFMGLFAGLCTIFALVVTANEAW